MQLQVETDELGSELEQLAKAKVCLTYLGSHFFVSFFHFYRAMPCIRDTSHGPVSVSPSVHHKSEFY